MGPTVPSGSVSYCDFLKTRAIENQKLIYRQFLDYQVQ